MAANYNCLLFDLDGTLFDFDHSSKAAFSAVLQHFNINCANEIEATETFSEINKDCWLQLEQNKLKKDKLGATRFSRILEKLGANGNPVEMNAFFENHIAENPVLFPGAKELLEELAEFATIAAITNGYTKTQTSRLEKSGLLPYFDGVFISEKIHLEKPNPKFFQKAISDLGIVAKNKVLVIGDSLTADIKGANNAGIDSCWCNFFSHKNETGITPTHTASTYAELKLYAIGKEELARAELREKRHTV